MIAAPDGAGGIVVHGSMQCPFYVQKAVASALGCDLSQARIVQTVTGGGFGGKEDAPSAPGAQVALLARATGRPVRLILSREEDMAVMSKRHRGRIHMRTGATADGRLVGCEVDYLLDGGAYATLSPVVLFRGAVHACGPYRVPNVRVDAHAVRTHTVPAGAFRGFGEPQVVFAAESQMDLLAERLGIDPLELRRRNALRGRGRDGDRPSPARERRLPRGARQGRGGVRTGRRSARPLPPTRGRCAAGSASPPATTAWGSGRWGST